MKIIYIWIRLCKIRKRKSLLRAVRAARFFFLLNKAKGVFDRAYTSSELSEIMTLGTKIA